MQVPTLLQIDIAGVTHGKEVSTHRETSTLGTRGSSSIKGLDIRSLACNACAMDMPVCFLSPVEIPPDHTNDLQTRLTTGPAAGIPTAGIPAAGMPAAGIPAGPKSDGPA